MMDVPVRNLAWNPQFLPQHRIIISQQAFAKREIGRKVGKIPIGIRDGE